MMYLGEKDYRHGSPEQLGVLLLNLGTPDAPTEEALRTYLREFLSDPRVIELPKWKWWPILHGIVLRTRPKRSAEAYAKVWDYYGEGTGSPLLYLSERQRDGLRRRLQDRLPGPVTVALGMRYGNPSVARALEDLRMQGARRVLVLPLYPQYSASTTASTFDAVTAALQKTRWIPELRFVNHYHRHPAYIEALAASVREHQAQHGRPQRLIMSFHGVPERYLLNGDPYHCECHVTGRLLAERLGLREGEWQVSFQSRFGREAWIKPYTDMTLKALPAEGIRDVQVICPGFSADCLETLEEIDQENREYFMQAGGERYSYIPALNDRADHLDMLAELVVQHVQGWPEAGPYDMEAMRAEWQASKARAQALGARQ
ncbi:MAG: ferrochelatase [Halothiobacillaceae bacterium]